MSERQHYICSINSCACACKHIHLYGKHICWHMDVVCLYADAAYGLLQKKSQLFSFNTNNALLQFILEVSNFIYSTVVL